MSVYNYTVYILYVPDWLVHTNLDICKTPYIYFLTLIHLTTTRTQWARSSKPHPFETALQISFRLCQALGQCRGAKKARKQRKSERAKNGVGGGKDSLSPVLTRFFALFFRSAFPTTLEPWTGWIGLRHRSHDSGKSYVRDVKNMRIGVGGACLITLCSVFFHFRPRALAVGERLWSAQSVTDLTDADNRLWEHRCRYLR